MSLKKKIIKKAMENPELRTHLLSILLKNKMGKTAGALWLEEYVTDKDPEKALKKLRERDFKDLQKMAIEEIKAEKIPENLQMTQRKKE
ncbi:MAG: hypothetical protein GF334_08290, partial [Candidatus Altiarchaeales archaeon]|nr:hypothetical protein [Candidatus Altiarchaeales archaeon]